MPSSNARRVSGDGDDKVSTSEAGVNYPHKGIMELVGGKNKPPVFLDFLYLFICVHLRPSADTRLSPNCQPNRVIGGGEIGKRFIEKGFEKCVCIQV